jgi:4-amino-4-deoxy-L-arabinose transferase-like glycosyltransferase
MRNRAIVLGAILTLAMCIQVGMVLLLAEPNGGGGPDSFEYSRHAQSMLRHGVYSLDGRTPDRMRQPGYPLFLAVVYALFGPSNTPVYYVQAVLNTVNVFLVWKLARILGLSSGVAAGAALLLAVYPPFARLSGLILNETLSILLLLSFAVVFVRTAAEPLAGRAIALGSLLGVHTLCRPITALFPVWLTVLMWFVLRRARPALRIGALATVGFALALVPWTARNAIVLGRATFLSTEGGASLYVGVRPDAEQIWDRGLESFLESGEVRAIIGDAYYISEEADDRFRAAAFSRLLQDPASSLLHGMIQVVKALTYMPGVRTVTREHPWLWGPLVAVPSALLALAIYGALTTRCRLMTALVLGIPVYYTAVLAPLFAVPRHMLPLFPFIAIGAAAGTASILARLASGALAPARGLADARSDRAGP